jgi:DNA-binding PadR family transcriptional regulator
MEQIERRVLELIAAHDGAYSWYQIDRALSASSASSDSNVLVLGGLIRELKKLEEHGLISSGIGHNPAQPVYTITARGKEALDAPVAAPLTEDRWVSAGDQGTSTGSKIR